MSGDVWAFLWIMIALKIPLAMLLYIVWWAIHAEPEPVESSDDDGGQRRDSGPRSHPPRPPRRGPHGDPAAPPPERVRTPHLRPHVPAGHR
jgi:hypothetical protein